MNKAEETLKYFKTLPSSFYTFGIPKAHYASHLYNFVNPYTEDNDVFWVKIRETTERFMTLDTAACPRFLFLCGCPGSGKTHYAVGLYRAMLKQRGLGSGGGGVFFTSFMSMVKNIIHNLNLPEEERIPIRVSLEAYLADRWLFLDDFTSSERVFKQDSMEFRLLRDIVINRWDSERTLITSSNLEAGILKDKLKEMFGDYLVSRISDSIILQFPDDDLRQRKELVV
jgi:DNA replication protein DnaC